VVPQKQSGSGGLDCFCCSSPLCRDFYYDCLKIFITKQTVTNVGEIVASLSLTAASTASFVLLI
jgi:hypothetical protein